MNKTEMIEAINKLPLFIERKAAVGNHIADSERCPQLVWLEDKRHKAITEEMSARVLAYTSPRYKLVQMKELFMPLVDKMEEIDGRLRYNEGFAIMDIFPLADIYTIGENTKIGICAYNSVDKTSALNIKFSVMEDGRVFLLPKKTAAFRKVHVGKIKEQTKDYIDFLEKIKTTWAGVHERLTTHKVPVTDFDEVLTSMGDNAKDRYWTMKKHFLYKDGEPSVWNIVLAVYDHIDKSKFKSDIHKRKHLDALTTTVLDYDFILKLG